MKTFTSTKVTYFPADLWPARDVWSDLGRRFWDIVLALVLGVLALPVGLIIAVLIKLDSPGPVFYGQERVGLNRRRQSRPSRSSLAALLEPWWPKWLPFPFAPPTFLERRRRDAHGRVFTMYKFRTMREDAEQETGPVWAQEEDPRVTRVGRFLRRTRLDELPQLWNILKGDMTFIGPRPERPFFVNQFQELIPAYSRRLEVKPGLTGLAQIYVGYDKSLEDVKRKVAYDLDYIERRSLWLDLQIIWQTVGVLLTGRGAR